MTILKTLYVEKSSSKLTVSKLLKALENIPKNAKISVSEPIGLYDSESDFYIIEFED